MRDRVQQGWVRPGWLNYLLLPISWGYICLIGLRTLLYKLGLYKTEKLEVPVIVVGAIGVGGSGKTPLVILLGQYLSRLGYKPGVVSRGYRARSTVWPREVSMETTSIEVGDEPSLIFETTNLPVVVGPSRFHNGLLLIERHGCNVIISDDGFQHFSLYRDLDIVVIDAGTGLGNGWCLPAGPLREPKSGLKRADIIMINGDNTTGMHYGDHTMHMQLGQARNLDDGSRVDIRSFIGTKVNAVAAVGNPERFFSQLETCGLDIDRRPFPDHYFFQDSDLDFKDKNPVLMTEKDGIKCRNMPNSDNFWVIEAQVVAAPGFYDRIDRLLAHS